MQHLFCKCETFHFFINGHIDELRLALVDHVVIANQVRFLGHMCDRLLRLQSFCNLKLLVRESIGNQAECDTNISFCDKVHLWHLFFLVVYYFVLFSYIKFSGHETESNVIKEVCLFGSVDVEETFELSEDVSEQVHSHNLILDLLRQSF